MKKQILILLMLFSIAFVSAQVPQAEKDALIALYDATNGANWSTNTNWKTNEPINMWYGVTVENGHIVSLRLNSNNLIGELPNELVNLTNLNTLYIYYNELQGKLPNLTSITTLKNLAISNNNFQFADFEDEFSTYKANLTRFYYAPMKNIGEEITHDYVEGNTYTMTMLEVAGTNVTYQWYKNDEPITGATSLTYTITNAKINDAANYTCKASSAIVTDLLISREPIHIYGKVSTEQKNTLIALYNATNGDNWTNKTNWNTNEPVYKWYGISVEGNKIIALNLTENNLTEDLPTEIGNLINLESLDLGGNKFSGSIPSVIGNLINLKNLSLSNNEFSGSIPSAIGNLVNLKSLYLGSNKLSGSIPSPIGNLVQLEYLSLSNNQLSGSLPTTMGNLTALKRLHLESNFFTGNLPTEFQNLTAITHLYLYGNQFSGDIPNIFTNWTELSQLVLETMMFNNSAKTNNFSGTLDVTNNLKLYACLVDNNNLSTIKINNGNNTNIRFFGAKNTPNLTCIFVDDKVYSAANWTNIDATSRFVETQAQCNADYTYVPDDNFEQALIDLGHDDVLDNYVLTSSIDTVTELDLLRKNISNLTGIQGFRDLKVLKCWENNISVLDVSKNLQLETLLCSQNQLTSINISNNLNLKTLNCSSNKISVIDVSNNPKLETLYCWNTNIDNIDASLNTNLSTLNCSSNVNLTSINIKNGNNNNIKYFKATSVPNLTCIYVDNANYSKTNWTNIDTTSTFVETQAQCNALYTYVPDDNFEQVLIDLGYDNVLDNYVPTSHINTVTTLDVNKKNISDLTGIEDFIELKELICANNSIYSLDVSNNVKLTYLFCSNNFLNSLDVSKNTELETLYCSSLSITSIDLSNNKKLRVLTTSNAPIGNLDVSNNKELFYLQCVDNNLSSLNVSTLDKLGYLSCGKNQIKELDLSNNPLLYDVFCENNQLTSLDLSNNPIKRLRVVNNPLTELNMQNGNNTNVTLFAARNVPNLTCIYVDDANYSKINWTNIDATSTFVETQDECSSLSVAENTFSSKNISVYPNPTNQFLNINSYTNIQKIIIYDILGKKVLATKNTSKINVSQLKVGMYLLSIKTTEGKTINKQFVKQ